MIFPAALYCAPSKNRLPVGLPVDLQLNLFELPSEVVARLLPVLASIGLFQHGAQRTVGAAADKGLGIVKGAGFAQRLAEQAVAVQAQGA